MTFDQILQKLKKGEYAPVYLLMGEEPYFIDQLADYITKNALKEDEKSFNQTIFYGKDVEVPALIMAARRYPVMSSRQVIILREAQEIKKIETLEVYVSAPAQTTVLVLCHKYKNVAKNTKLYKQAEKNGVVFESKKLYDNQVPDWIKKYLASANLQITPEAAALLTEYLGTDLKKIANELDKLLLGRVGGNTITPQEIQDNIGINKDYNIFELQKALSKRNVLKSNQIINYFAATPKDNPLPVVIGSLFTFFRKILTLHFAKSKTTQDRDLAAIIQVNPYFMADYKEAAKNYPAGKVIQIISALRECDLKSKGVDNSSGTTDDLLKELIFKILH